MLTTSYRTLRQGITSLKVEDNELHELIQLLSPVINSPRRCSSIYSWEELLHELEKRLLLSPTDINILLDIAYLVNMRKISKLINNHIDLLYKWNQETKGNSIRRGTEGVIKSDQILFPSEVVTLLDEKLPRSTWIGLARCLGFNEDDFERMNYFSGLDDRKECLQRFALTADVRTKYQRLFKAIKSARRTDIQEELEDLLRQNVFKYHWVKEDANS